MRRAIFGIVMAALAGCSNSEPQYEVSQGSIAAYMNPGQSADNGLARPTDRSDVVLGAYSHR